MRDMSRILLDYGHRGTKTRGFVTMPVIPATRTKQEALVRLAFPLMYWLKSLKNVFGKK